MKQHTSKEFTYPARIIQMNANAAAAIAAARAFARAASADYGDAGF